MLSHGGGERDDIVLGDLFDLLYASDVESAALSDVARRLRRHDPRAGHRLGGGCLNLQPRLVPSLFTPHPTHFRARVPCNHRRVSTSFSTRTIPHLSKRQPLRRQLQAIDGSQYRGRERTL